MSYNEIEITKSSDLELFQELVTFLEIKLDINFDLKLDGLDQNYYDFRFKNNKYTLHREHYLGISLIGESKFEELKKLAQILSKALKINKKEV